MAKHVAIEWDSREVRVLVASSRAGSVSVDHAAAFPTPETDTPQELPAAIGQYIADHAKSLQVPANSNCLIALGRGQVEARSFDVPPVPADELPVIVEMQAPQQFSQMSEDWTLDFYPQKMDDDLQAASVLAAAVSPDTVADVIAICGPATLTPGRISLRPLLTAALLCERYNIDMPILAVDILADQIELTIVHDHSAPIMRTVQLPASGSHSAESIVAEVKRTLASASHASDDLHVEKIILLGDTDDSEAYNALKNEFDLDVELLNPFALTHGGEVPKNIQDIHCGRYASLIGLIDTAISDRRPAIDFAAPRKAPAPPSVTEKHGRTAILAAAVILLLVVSLYLPIRSRSSELESLNAQIESGQVFLDRQEEMLGKDLIIDRYQGKSKNWLDQLVYLCDTFPNSDDAIVADFRANTEARPFDTTGQSKAPLWSISMEVAVRDYGVLQTLEDSVRSNVHTIQSSGLSKTEEAVRYPWLTREVIRIVPGSIAQTSDDSSETESEAQPEATSTETTVSTEDPAPADDPSDSVTEETSEDSDTADTDTVDIDSDATEDTESSSASDDNETT